MPDPQRLVHSEPHVANLLIRVLALDQVSESGAERAGRRPLPYAGLQTRTGRSRSLR